MARRWSALGLVAGVTLVAAVALTKPAEPDAAKVQQAAQSYDAGVRAWNAGRYEAAASYFEAADDAVPSAVSLTEAIQSRRRARQAARAATLAASALTRYPGDASLVALAREVLDEQGPALHRIDFRCAEPCVVAVGTRIVTSQPTRQGALFVEPGETDLSASFVEGGGTAHSRILASAGGHSSLDWRPPSAATSAEPAHPQPSATARAPTAPSATASARRPSSSSTPAPPPSSAVAPAGEADSGLPPLVFYVAAGATAVAGGLTLWSGIDTLESPGVDAVRAECVGLGTDCPAYQEGLDKELRTNVLIAVTAGVAALTAAVGIWWTDWGTSGASPPAAGAARWRLGPGAASVAWTFD